METRNHYQVLGVSKDATLQEIKIAYRDLALQYHPDKNPNTEELFKEIVAAHETLSDPAMRKDYDNKLANPQIQTQTPQAKPAPQNQKKIDYVQTIRGTLVELKNNKDYKDNGWSQYLSTNLLNEGTSAVNSNEMIGQRYNLINNYNKLPQTIKEIVNVFRSMTMLGNPLSEDAAFDRIQKILQKKISEINKEKPEDKQKGFFDSLFSGSSPKPTPEKEANLYRFLYMKMNQIQELKDPANVAGYRK